jgi:dienelactone hydrolase
MMPIRLLNRISVLGAVAAVLLGASGVPARQADRIVRAPGAQPSTLPWDLDELSAAPVHQWSTGAGAVRSLFYEGEPYLGRPTRVFAYYANPATLDGSEPGVRTFPGVVLVHGGGGTAFRDWVELWARRGYAAVAMDLAGCGPERERLPDGGPDQTDAVKFGAIDRPPEDQWPYHAVANVIRAHSLLRSFREVDARRTAVTGISWGGYLTCIVAGLDKRFQAAVPVYGCGYLHENSVWLNRFAEMTDAQKDRWVRWWDPSRYIGSAAMPVFFVNGTNDFAYPLDSYAKTYGLVQGARNLRITVNMPHSHPDGWAPPEIGLFIDQHLAEGLPLPVVGRPVCEDGRVRAEVTSRCPLVAAQLHFTTGNTPVNALAWTSTPAHLDANGIVSADLPGDATLWFLTVTDSRDAVVSSEVVFSKDGSTCER